jgi:hypothetical protein
MIHYRVHKSSPPAHVLSQTNPVLFTQSHPYRIHLNIIYPPTSVWLIPLDINSNLICYKALLHCCVHVMQHPCRRNGVFWDVTPCGSCKNRRFGELSASIRVTRIDELGTTLAVTSNRRTLRALFLVHRFLSR